MTTAAPGRRRDYDRLRRTGMRAADAYREATAGTRPVEYRDGPGDAITLALDNPALSRLVITATAELTDDDDLREFGEFTHADAADTVPVRIAGRTAHFRSTYPLAQRRADLSRLGYARGQAHDLALHQIREDAHLHSTLKARYVRVEVRKAGVLLGDAGIETWLREDEDPRVAMAAVIADHGLFDDALAEARRALPLLIEALSA
ncbi:hypothetical protein [Actinokineospora iranica]|uniref:Uncharacterized protein n=1 Tax=Actinokineospora iranica TaxID=1271860 RepID=A0A1G6VQB3_9PSEU|nr:hypothetical protein [Actinokineospora iranica]SDD55739.1 hypothetical protein SAMN05216174_11337 [Actinokineospora iranica]